MRLSHKKKVASKHGLYWPTRTKQARERREALQRYVAKVVSVSADTAAFVSAVGQAVEACKAMCRGVQHAAKEMVSWLLPRDPSQVKPTLASDGHTEKICLAAPRNVKK
ncbi:hypothetical protein AU461_23170 [Vibrio parahaemolyticus]|uniref:hypothetical protein n=1 Tax=Vibrio parahaemolyticus TaxID=670 RepID=UPI000789C0C0|nr:hypothetical protein [Vibrio parahaemolyticus]KYO58421.1 hypothetical protein AU461_23170 [Vibrio parahaemolyticus]KYX47744.1 hypothetical protein AU389_02070 [Vibrio parahaemolyticus]